MLKLRLTIVLAILGFSLCSFVLVKDNAENPPGTTSIDKSGKWIDKQEMSILGWQKFYYYIKNKYGNDSAMTLIPDTSKLMAYYKVPSFSHLSFEEKDKLPIIGVSLNQIKAFCKFRTEAVNIKYHLDIVYEPLESSVYDHLNAEKVKIRKFVPVGTNIPEMIVLPNNSLKLISVSQATPSDDIFGFRCVAVKK